MRSAGYTLIELLVVISIISIMSVMGFISFKGFASDQVSKKAAGQVQTILRLAQSNATSATLCNGQGALSWYLKFLSNAKTIELHCSNNSADYLQRIYILDNATVSIKCSPASISSLSLPVTISYSPLSGTVSFTGDTLDTCISQATSLFIKITNSQDPASTKSLTISKGGTINVQ